MICTMGILKSLANASNFEVAIIKFTIGHYTTNDIDPIDKSEHTHRHLKGHCDNVLFTCYVELKPFNVSYNHCNCFL